MLRRVFFAAASGAIVVGVLTSAACVGDLPPQAVLKEDAAPLPVSDAGEASVPDAGCGAPGCETKAVQVSVGGDFTCAVLRNGKVWCWGASGLGATGALPRAQSNGTCGALFCQPKPAEVAGLDGIVEVRAGGHHACARTGIGDVYCWGANNEKQLGRDTTTACTPGPTDAGGGSVACSDKPAKVILPEPAAQLALSERATCARTTKGNVYCWGSNSVNQLGLEPAGGASSTPQRIGDIFDDAIELAISAGLNNETVCVVRKSGAVSCWGKLGGGLFSGVTLGPTDGSSVPRRLSGVTSASNLVVLPEGAICVLTPNKTAMCMGHNLDGVRAVSDENSFSTELDTLPGLPAVTQIVGRYTTLIALEGEKQGWAWGWSGSGQLADGKGSGVVCAGAGRRCTKEVTRVDALKDIAQVDVEQRHAAAVTKDGRVLTWGLNEWGQLGHAPGISPDTKCQDADVTHCTLSPAQVEGLP